MCLSELFFSEEATTFVLTWQQIQLAQNTTQKMSYNNNLKNIFSIFCRFGWTAQKTIQIYHCLHANFSICLGVRSFSGSCCISATRSRPIRFISIAICCERFNPTIHVSNARIDLLHEVTYSLICWS